MFFVFSTVLFSLSVMNITAFQVQALGVPLILLAIVEYFHKNRGLVIGILLGFAVMTRITLVFAVVFFIMEFFLRRIGAKKLFVILLPVIAALVLLGLYNNRRFHSFFETGYNYNISLKSFPGTENLKHGASGLIHLPANLYSFLIMPPQPLFAQQFGFVLKFPYLTASHWGMAIWFTTPLLLLGITRFKKWKYTLPAGVAALCIAIPNLTYYSLGSSQFGYRYAADFLPFLFLILIPCLSKPLKRTEVILITAGVLFNLVYADSLFGVYPLLGIL